MHGSSDRETRATRRVEAWRMRANGLHRERILEYASVADTVPAMRACRAIRPPPLRFAARRRTILRGLIGQSVGLMRDEGQAADGGRKAVRGGASRGAA